MRITKKMLRDKKAQIRAKVADVFKMDDDHLKTLLKNYAPAFDLQGTREEMLHRAVVWALEEIIPDQMIW